MGIEIGVIIALVIVSVVFAWIVLPFAVIGTKPRITKTNEKLDTIIELLRDEK